MCADDISAQSDSRRTKMRKNNNRANEWRTHEFLTRAIICLFQSGKWPEHPRHSLHPAWQLIGSSKAFKCFEKLSTPSQCGRQDRSAMFANDTHSSKMLKTINYNLITRYARWREFNYTTIAALSEGGEKSRAFVYRPQIVVIIKGSFWRHRELLNLII